MTKRKPTALEVLTELLRDRQVEDADELAILALKRLADAGCLRDEQLRRCGLFKIVLQESA